MVTYCWLVISQFWRLTFILFILLIKTTDKTPSKCYIAWYTIKWFLFLQILQPTCNSWVLSNGRKINVNILCWMSIWWPEQVNLIRIQHTLEGCLSCVQTRKLTIKVVYVQTAVRLYYWLQCKTNTVNKSWH